jgi:hypothetical protein
MRSRIKIDLLLFASVMIFTICTFPRAGMAQFVGGFGHAEQKPGPQTLVRPTHGFHCRPVLGWDPRAGVYHVHRHEGICRDYGGCWKKSQNCIFLLGRGWGGWEWDRWGSDNWRYYSCMMQTGCY